VGKLIFENVSYAYDDVLALNQVSFSAKLDEITGLIGANGAGKTTSIKNIVTYLMPKSGNIYLDTLKIHEIKIEQFLVSFISDSPVFYEELSIEEHLQFTKALFFN
jgi:ABC-2 type transport system ATP-binding protein